jgi:hypothetical protein
MSFASRFTLIFTLTCLLALSGCGLDERLESITVSPNNLTITGAGLEVHYVALGHYSHPANTKDITGFVTWASSAPQIISVEQTGVATSGLGCDTGLQITATSNASTPHKSDSVIVGGAIVNVKQPAGTNPNCT